jgi:hypothetical protein
MMARYYSSFQGRFLSPDPKRYFSKQISQSFNLYNYSLANPIKYTDPTGKMFLLMIAPTSGDVWAWAEEQALEGEEKYGKEGDEKKKEEEEKEKSRLENLHYALDLASLGMDAITITAVLSWIPDVINAAIHFVEGNWKEGAISMAAAVPIIGSALKGKGLIKKATEAVVKWVGKDAKAFHNAAGDLIIMSKDGTKKIHFDIKKPYPHKSPHVNFEEFKDGKWISTKPTYPKDVPKE